MRRHVVRRVAVRAMAREGRFPSDRVQGLQGVDRFSPGTGPQMGGRGLPASGRGHATRQEASSSRNAGP